MQCCLHVRIGCAYDDDIVRIVGDTGGKGAVLEAEAFYKAFAHYNLQHQDKPIYLIQGVWAPVPEDHDYLDDGFSLSTRTECDARVSRAGGS